MAEEGEAEVALIECPVDPASAHLTTYSSKRLDVYARASTFHISITACALQCTSWRIFEPREMTAP
jgi:hypothetical protein